MVSKANGFFICLISSIANKTKIVLNLSHEDKSKLEKIVIKHASKFTWAKTARETANIYKLL